MAGLNNSVLDTNIILYAAVNNDVIALEILENSNVYISDITEIELLGYHRIQSSEYEILKDVISNLNVIPINGDIKQNAIHLRREHALRTPDAIIAATALYLGYTLYTTDKKILSVA